MQKTFIVNTGWTFSALWGIAKVFLDEKTKKKVNIEGSSFKKQLLKEVDPDQLPEWLGGTNKRELYEVDDLLTLP